MGRADRVPQECRAFVARVCTHQGRVSAPTRSCRRVALDHLAELRVVEELGIADRIVLPGWIEHGDSPAVYAAADLFAFPSLYEGFGIPLIEAMACGCPIVTANTCAPPEVCDGAAQLVNPLDVDDIAAAMRRVLSDGTLRAKMVARGLERARDFSWEKCARQVLEAFDHVAGAYAAESGTESEFQAAER